MARRTSTAKRAESTKVVTKENNQQQPSIANALLSYITDPNINLCIANDTLSEEQQAVVKALDNAMATLPDMVLCRVTTYGVVEKYLEQAGVSKIADLAGKTLSHVPFLSTTKKTLDEVLERRLSLGLGKPICFIIHTEGKAKGIDVVEALEKEGFGEALSARQKEVLLARGQQYFVKKVTTDCKGGESFPIIHFYVV